MPPATNVLQQRERQGRHLPRATGSSHGAQETGSGVWGCLFPGELGDGSTMSLGHRALGGAHDPCPPSGTIRPRCPGGGGGGALWSRSQQAHLRAPAELGKHHVHGSVSGPGTRRLVQKKAGSLAFPLTAHHQARGVCGLNLTPTTPKLWGPRYSKPGFRTHADGYQKPVSLCWSM